MTKEEINKILEKAKELGIDFSSIPKDAEISSAEIIDDKGEKKLIVTYTQAVSGNKKEHCEQLIKKWKDSKPVYTQDGSSKFIPLDIPPEEMRELNDIMGELKKECWEFLSEEEKLEIEKLIE